MTGPYLARILTGEKPVESRFHRVRQAPLYTVHRDDVVVFKQAGMPVTAAAVVTDATFLEVKASSDLHRIRNAWASQIGAEDDDFWAARALARWVSLLRLRHPVSVAPLRLSKRDRRGWVSY